MHLLQIHPSGIPSPSSSESRTRTTSSSDEGFTENPVSAPLWPKYSPGVQESQNYQRRFQNIEICSKMADKFKQILSSGLSETEMACIASKVSTSTMPSWTIDKFLGFLYKKQIIMTVFLELLQQCGHHNIVTAIRDYYLDEVSI